ncbi:hypothetical protein B0H13DRAFT_1961170 [Mycena leptocephala]|nr:hypothetical protein B0H13DRAFT_1961170 [Mycena leptocephala]
MVYMSSVNVWGLDIYYSRVSIYLFFFPSLFFLWAASMSLFPYYFLPSLFYIVLTFLRAERCACASRGGDVRLRRPTRTHRRLGTRSPADGARGACRQRSDLRGVRGIVRSEPGTPAMHIVCSRRGHQPSLSTPHPIIPSLYLWTPRLRACLPSQHCIFTKKESPLPHAARRLIYGL